VIWIKGCGIIASKQLPKAGFNRLAIKKSMIGSESSITFFSHKQRSKSELAILFPRKNGKSNMTALFCLILNSFNVLSYFWNRK